MKLPLLGAAAAMTFAMATTALAAESNNTDTASGAPDSAVMTQTHKVKVDNKAHKQVKADENKRGRPTAKSDTRSN